MTKGNGDQEVVSREHDKIEKKALEQVLEKLPAMQCVCREVVWKAASGENW